MTNCTRTLFVGVCLLFVTATPVQAFGWRWSRPAYYSPIVCYAEPVYIVPLRCVPISMAPAKMYAVPTQAPASQTKEPPLGPGMPPKISESYYYERHYSPPTPDTTATAATQMCRVGFWNASSRDLRLTIAGRAYTLERNQSLTLDLPRAFSWQVDGDAARAEHIAAALSTHEIVIR